MTSKRVGLVTVAQLETDLPWVVALTDCCDVLLVIAKSRPLLTQFADQLQIADKDALATVHPCTFEFVEADLDRTEGQGRLTDLIRQRGPIYCALHLCGHPGDVTYAAVNAVATDRLRTSSANGERMQSTFVDAAMDGVLASIRRDIDATLLLSQAVLAGMKQAGLGVLLHVWIDGPIDRRIKPFSEATSQFIGRFSMGLSEQLGEPYPKIKIQFFRWVSVTATDSKQVISNTPETLLKQFLDKPFLFRQ